jgi:hypothetical protein
MQVCLYQSEQCYRWLLADCLIQPGVSMGRLQSGGGTRFLSACNRPGSTFEMLPTVYKRISHLASLLMPVEPHQGHCTRHIKQAGMVILDRLFSKLFNHSAREARR